MTHIDRFHIRHPRLTPPLTLVAVNAAMFVALRIAAIIVRFAAPEQSFEAVIDSVILPASWSALLTRPWTLLTYMFVQYDPLHLMMNCLWLYMFAAIADRIVTPTRLYAIYLVGGIAGAAAYLIVGNAAGIQNAVGLTGASAAVLAIMGMTMAMRPDMKLNLVFFGEASLKIVGLIAILLVVLSTGLHNYGTHAAHAGGFICGLILGLKMKSGRVTPRMQPIAVQPQTSAPHREPTTADTGSDMTDSEMLDTLLDKIRRSGYGSLTATERDILFRISSKLQKPQQ